jgi:hypothetical protein
MAFNYSKLSSLTSALSTDIQNPSHTAAGILQSLLVDKLGKKSIKLSTLLKYFKDNISTAPVTVPFPQTIHIGYDTTDSEEWVDWTKYDKEREEVQREHMQYVYDMMPIVIAGKNKGTIIIYKQSALQVFNKVTSLADKSFEAHNDTSIPFLYQTYCYALDQDIEYLYIVGRWLEKAHISDIDGRKGKGHARFLSMAEGKGKFVKRINTEFYIVNRPTKESALLELINDANTFGALLSEPDWDTDDNEL